MNCVFEKGSGGWTCATCGRIVGSAKRPVAKCNGRTILCPHRSPAPSRTVAACGCGSSVAEQPVYRCELYNVECVDRAFRIAAGSKTLCPFRSCLECRAENENAITPTSSDDVMLGWIDRRQPLAWPREWEKWSNTHEAHRRLFARKSAEILQADGPSLGCRGRGRGIVTLGGGVKYFASAYVLVFVLRRLGCSLPVGWYVLPGEVNDEMTAAAKSLGGVEIVDLRAVVGDTPRMFGGWEAKVWSILYSPFREVLFLDADIVPARNPTYLFDVREYQSAGAVLWPDLRNGPGLDVTEAAFRVLDLPVPGKTFDARHHNPTDYRPVESGQMMFDKSRVWRALEHVAMLNDHSDYLFRMPRGQHHWHIYGDKSTFLLGFAKAQQSYAMPRDTWFIGDDSSGGFMQHDFAGRIVFQHKCQPGETKLQLHGRNKAPRRKDPAMVADFANWPLVEEALADLRTKWSGQL